MRCRRCLRNGGIFTELNPLVAVLQGFRWSLVSGVAPPSVTVLLTAIAISLLFTITGLSVFARLEQFAVDRA